jgi:hypothetical protein
MMNLWESYELRAARYELKPRTETRDPKARPNQFAAFFLGMCRKLRPSMRL